MVKFLKVILWGFFSFSRVVKDFYIATLTSSSSWGQHPLIWHTDRSFSILVQSITYVILMQATSNNPSTQMSLTYNLISTKHSWSINNITIITYWQHDPWYFFSPSAFCAWPGSRVSLILRDPEINSYKDTANDKSMPGMEKERKMDSKRETFFAGMALYLQGMREFDHPCLAFYWTAALWLGPKCLAIHL